MVFAKLQGRARKLSTIVVAVCVLAVAGAALAGASTATPSSSASNQYTGCLVGGILVNVAIGTSPTFPCPRSTTQITWNQQGPAGPPGPAGAPGAQGNAFESSATIPANAGENGGPPATVVAINVPTGTYSLTGFFHEVGICSASATGGSVYAPGKYEDEGELYGLATITAPSGTIEWTCGGGTGVGNVVAVASSVSPQS
jgi:hypothetical protein